MTVPHHDGGERSSVTGPTASALADPWRRVVLATLLEAAGPLDLDRLTREIQTRFEVADEDRLPHESVSAALHHTHLPALEAAGLVDRPAPDRVELADHPVLAGDTVTPETLQDHDRPWDALADVATHPRRLHVVACLADRSSWRLEGLAAAVRSRMPTTHLDDVPGNDIAALLHHVDLPRLADVGVLSYDVEARRVERQTLPDLALLPAWVGSLAPATDGGTAE